MGGWGAWVGCVVIRPSPCLPLQSCSPAWWSCAPPASAEAPQLAGPQAPATVLWACMCTSWVQQPAASQQPSAVKTAALRSNTCVCATANSSKMVTAGPACLQPQYLAATLSGDGSSAGLRRCEGPSGSGPFIFDPHAAKRKAASAAAAAQAAIPEWVSWLDRGAGLRELWNHCGVHARACSAGTL